MMKRAAFLGCFVLAIACFSLLAQAKDKDAPPELNKKRSDPDYILEKYTDIFKTTDYGALTVGPPFITLKMAGIDYSSGNIRRSNLRSILQGDPKMFPLRIYIVDDVEGRYNEKCAVFVVPQYKTTIQEIVLKEGLAKATDHCLTLYPYYADSFKRAEESAKAEKKGLWEYENEEE